MCYVLHLAIVGHCNNISDILTAAFTNYQLIRNEAGTL